MDIETTETTQTGVEVAERSVEDRLEAMFDAEDETPTEESSSSDTDETAEEAEKDASEESVEPEEGETVELEASQLAEILGIDPESLNWGEEGLKVKTKIDGEVGEATLADLIKSYQLEGHVQKKSQALADAQRMFDEQMQAANAHIEAQLATSNQFLNALEMQLVGKYQNINWEHLRMTDPAEFAAMQAEYQNDVNALGQMKQQAMYMMSERQQAVQMQYEQATAQVLAEQAQLLKDKIPEWRDVAKAKQEKAEIVSWLKNRGYPDHILAGITDATVVADIREFWQFKKAQEANQKSAKPVPKIQRAGARVKPQADPNKIKQLRAKAREGDSDALTAMLMDRV